LVDKRFFLYDFCKISDICGVSSKQSISTNQIQNMSADLILIEKQENGVCVLTFNRPKVYNAFNQATCQALQAALDDCESDDTVRCVVLTGAGKAFCAGQDLAEVTQENPPTFKEILDDGYNPIVLKITALSKPVIAAVNGVAAGAGANIALACDIVVATESASFIQAFSKIGLIPDNGGTFTLPRLIGTARAMALMMTGEKVNAKSAETMGMIYRCEDDELFKGNVMILAAQLAAMPTQSLALIKKAVHASMNSDLKTQLSLETHLQGQAAQTADYREGVSAFMEKRQPTFSGQ
jgi:2-(1,2-epoxy-1,2-dihydrophenyl)acetyl-CoA isomerase